MNIQITADSTCDLGPALLRANQIIQLPLYVTLGSEVCRDGVDAMPDDVYAHVAQGDDCSTAALNLADYVNFFSELSRKHDAVIHVCLGSGFSSCYQNAKLAAAEYPNVYVVDSQNLSSGHGHVVLLAKDLADEGKSPEEILAILEDAIPRVRASFVISQLEYLKRGGRCSSLAALGANLLKLRPSIVVENGLMHVAKKYHGKMDRCIREYVRDQLAEVEVVPTRVFITHSGVEDELVAAAREELEQSGLFREIHVTRAGCTVSCHCGPGTLGVLFLVK
ncbi:MAG: DegV family protein [Oscillospiraceae bacterium]|nr:DegV family protein [Oscillospiraceae bacterium]